MKLQSSCSDLNRLYWGSKDLNKMSVFWIFTYLFEISEAMGFWVSFILAIKGGSIFWSTEDQSLFYNRSLPETYLTKYSASNEARSSNSSAIASSNKFKGLLDLASFN